MARDLTPEEQEAERQARAAVDPAAIQLDVIRAIDVALRTLGHAERMEAIQ